MNSFCRYLMLVALAAVSALAGAQTMVSFAPAPLRAAKAEATLISADLAPAPGPQSAPIPRADDGHYWAQAQMNGQPIKVLVDTGATAVSLTPADAVRLGLKAKDLHYSSKVITAAGTTRAATVKLASITVAGARLDNVDALVIENGLDTSLLGMSYLGRLTRFEASRKGLVLQP